MKIVTITGLTYQAGATTIATAVAWNLTAQANYKVLLLNANANEANADYQLGISDASNMGWIKALHMQTQPLLSGTIFDEKLYYLSTGVIGEKINPKDLSNIIDELKSLDLDFIIIDAGTSDNESTQIAQNLADLNITVFTPTPNALIRFNSIKPNSNEYFLTNKLRANSSVMNDIVLILQNSIFANHLLKPIIPDDEFIMMAHMQQQPFTRYAPYCASSMEINKLVIDILLNTEKI